MPRRAKIEAGARKAFPQMAYRRCQTRGGPVHTYEVELEIPGYENRRVWVEFWPPVSANPRVYVDGPTDSPHRFAERDWTRLCIWYPGDPDDRRWVPGDGLLRLFGMVATHLFKEAWWRETRELDGVGQWLGEEAPHGPLTGEEDDGERDAS